MAKTVYLNGTVYTGKGRFAQAFETGDGVFLRVGTDADIARGVTDGDVTVDLGGKFVCAGFTDSHMHLLTYGYALNSVMLAGHTASLADVKREIGRFIEQNGVPDGEWVTAVGWNQDYFTDCHRMPNRHDLDEVTTTRPVIAYRCCEHCVVLNTAAMDALGITEDTVSPEGGAVGRDSDGLGGLLFDNAIPLATSHIPPPSEKTLEKYILDACRALNAYGITGVHTDDYTLFKGVSPQTLNAIYRKLADEGKLTVRVTEQCNLDRPDAYLAFAKQESAAGNGDGLFSIGPFKVLGDGSLGARTALLTEPYADAPDTRGLAIYTRDELERIADIACENGFSIVVHAIGDGCLDTVLDVIEAAKARHPGRVGRDGIVHCQVTRPDQLERIRRLGLCVYAQTVFLDYDIQIVEARLGKRRAATSYSWGTLLRGGTPVANGSDCPVELPDVMRGIQCAVTRKRIPRGADADSRPYLPEQAFSVAEAIDSFTIGPAYASFDENRKGRVAPGFLADFTVLSANPFETPPDSLHEIRVERVVLGGKTVYCAGS